MHCLQGKLPEEHICISQTQNETQWAGISQVFAHNWQITPGPTSRKSQEFYACPNRRP